MARLQALVLGMMLTVLVYAAEAAPVDYVFDTVHSRITFYISHWGFSHSVGFFKIGDGHFSFDANEWAQSAVDITIPVSSLDLGDATWNSNVLGLKWLDVAAYPTMRFVSKQVEGSPQGSGKIDGVLTLRGVTQPVALDLRLNQLGEHPMRKVPAVGFTATTTIRRSDFGLQSSLGAVGDDVQIRIEVEALASKP
jgi:polyisoprenoid-binding protein YceI